MPLVWFWHVIIKTKCKNKNLFSVYCLSSFARFIIQQGCDTYINLSKTSKFIKQTCHWLNSGQIMGMKRHFLSRHSRRLTLCTK